jgi:NTE family protein
MKHLGLVLQGGGALGAYEAGALERLLEEPHFQPTIISGVSIGAINAAALAGAKNNNPVKTLHELWKRFTVKSPLPAIDNTVNQMMAIWGNNGFFSMRNDYFDLPHWTSFYDISPLRETLEDLIDFEKINSGKKRLLITATNVGTGAIEIFRTCENKITAEHIIASGSLPPGFPPTKINSNYYWDGGLFNNTPLSPVINEFPETEDQLKIIVVNLYPAAGKLPANMLDVFGRSVEIIFSNKTLNDSKRVGKINELLKLFAQLDKKLKAQKSTIRESKEYENVLNFINRYKAVRILNITHDEAEQVYSSFDFSAESIKKRWENGYEDTNLSLKNEFFFGN